MKIGFVGFVLSIGVFVLAENVSSNPYFDEGDNNEVITSEDDYNDAAAVENWLHAMQQKRGCVRRGGSCDHRPNDCCFGASCRCNLWGSNCKCQRVGLFQKWG